jgi:hypothetical protein
MNERGAGRGGTESPYSIQEPAAAQVDDRMEIADRPGIGIVAAGCAASNGRRRYATLFPAMPK